MWWCQIIDWLKFETRPRSLLNFRMANMGNEVSFWAKWQNMSEVCPTKLYNYLVFVILLGLQGDKDKAVFRMSELFKVFVYGTLKKGFANHHLMQNGAIGVVQFVTGGLTKEAFPLVVGTDASIPFLLPLKGQGKVNKNISL